MSSYELAGHRTSAIARTLRNTGPRTFQQLQGAFSMSDKEIMDALNRNIQKGHVACSDGVYSWVGPTPSRRDPRYWEELVRAMDIVRNMIISDRTHAFKSLLDQRVREVFGSAWYVNTMINAHAIVQIRDSRTKRRVYTINEDVWYDYYRTAKENALKEKIPYR